MNELIYVLPDPAGQAVVSYMIDKSWFDCLDKPGLREDFSWLADLPSQVERIANFGCWTGREPFALMWTLGAKEVTVVEIDEKNIEELSKRIEMVAIRCPDSLESRIVKSLHRDMTRPVLELPDQYFDLAYCKNVLYTLPLGGDVRRVERGIEQMVRVVKPNGFVIAVEPQFGSDYKTRKVLGADMVEPGTATEPKDMTGFFSSHPLTRIEIPGSSPYAYCYQKNSQ